MPPDHIVSRFCDRLNIRLLALNHGGPGPARNEGARHARGRFLVFLDDDCAPRSDWLRAISLRFDADPEYAVGGRTVNALPGNVYSAASQMQISYLYSWYNREPENPRFLCSNNLAVPAATFHALNGFDGEWPVAGGEDREFCARWSRAGYRLIYAPEAIVDHRHSLTFTTFCNQHFRYGRGAGYLRRRAGSKERLRFEPFRFYWRLMLYPFSQAKATRAVVLSSLQFLSQVLTLCGLFYETLKPRSSPAMLAGSGVPDV